MKIRHKDFIYDTNNIEVISRNNGDFKELVDSYYPELGEDAARVFRFHGLNYDGDNTPIGAVQNKSGDIFCTVERAGYVESTIEAAAESTIALAMTYGDLSLDPLYRVTL